MGFIFLRRVLFTESDVVFGVACVWEEVMCLPVFPSITCVYRDSGAGKQVLCCVNFLEAVM